MPIEVSGLSDLISKLDSIGTGIASPEAMKEVFLPGAQLVRDKAKAIVHVKSGEARDNIFAVPGAEGLPDCVAGISLERVPYAHKLETEFPYLRPAADSSGDEVLQLAAAALSKKIEELAR